MYCHASGQGGHYNAVIVAMDVVKCREEISKSNVAALRSPPASGRRWPASRTRIWSAHNDRTSNRCTRRRRSPRLSQTAWLPARASWPKRSIRGTDSHAGLRMAIRHCAAERRARPSGVGREGI